ncbi:hypothetical protein DZF91_06160 [Actinomadura logoneensis]|uniref:Uncharacterized protein n=1 Tax=Actinomadura logoneensis TaxID=2293572 RepID=A0A372JRH0_9ACTN|nr:DUF6585 family protein [Actinomadura logoneensis]RFU42549.1 hypothetical protein DZF91_06160 [Actinomadura logoneensis]
MLERAAAHGLGVPVRVFDARTGRRRAVGWLVLLGLAVLVLAPAAALYLRSGRFWIGLLAASLAVAYLALAVRIALRAGLRERMPVVYLFGGGLVYAGTGRAVAYHWDDLSAVTVAGVRTGARGRTRWRFTVTAEGGRDLPLDDRLPDVRRLGEVVVAEVTARVVPRLAAAVRGGETVRLGTFEVGPEGVAKDGQQVPWPAVRHVSMMNGLVRVETIDGGRELTALAAQTPNAVALVELCARLAAVRDRPVH